MPEPAGPPKVPEVPLPDDPPLSVVPEEAEPLVPELSLVPEFVVEERDGFFFVLLFSVSLEVAPEDPEESVVPDISVLPEEPDESVIPLLPDEPDEPVPELCATAMPVPSAEMRTAIKSFFIHYLHRETG